VLTEQDEQRKKTILALKAKKANNDKYIDLFRFRWWLLLLSTFVGGGLLYFESVVKGSVPPTLVDSLPPIIIGSIGGAFFYALFVGYITLLYSMIGNRIDSKLAMEGVEELQENIEDNFFTQLVRINFKYIDQYYRQTQEQANKSFILAMLACVSGLIIVGLGIIMMYQGKTDPAYVTTSTGLLTEFIAAIFFYLYNKTIVKMAEYHQKLVITQNISLALKIAQELPDAERVEAQKELIKQLSSDVNIHLSSVKSIANN
jgi:hypothetical protein